MTFPSLADHATKNAARFGGKSAHLAGLAARGFPIPAGFALPVDVVLAWQAPLMPQIEAELATLSTLDEREVSERILQLFLSNPLGAALREEIAASCQIHLPDGLKTLVAVRSSAVGEDAAEASFAGQFESRLGLRSIDQIDSALRTVWASLYSPRAIRYRHEANLPAAASPMGVTVLEMVDAVASGVAFSVDVVTGKRDRIIIESTLGLAEPLVQGQITPDRFVVDKAEARLMITEVGQKEVICQIDPKGGTTTRPATENQQSCASLPSSKAEHIGETVTRLEAVMGHPVDIEWAIGTDNQLRLLQVRPISSVLPPHPQLIWDRASCFYEPI
jgi:pyruvate,water dikinase